MLDKKVLIWLSKIISGNFELKQIEGRANSKIFKIKIKEGDNYALKIYPDRSLDKRDRLGVEFDTLKKLRSYGIDNIPNTVEKEYKLNIALYEWIEGDHLKVIKRKEINDALGFIRNLVLLSKTKNTFSDKLASEACLSGNELVKQISTRLKRLSNISNESDLTSFLNNKFVPIFSIITNQVKHSWQLDQAFNNDLDIKFRRLSPSDFGFHNAIKRKDNHIIYIDFEYFGWDDPVKLTSDFVWHAGMNLTNKASSDWTDGMKSIFSDDPEFDDRLQLLHPLFGLRWGLILLNEFLPKVWKIRKHAGQKHVMNREEIKKIQLTKAEHYLEKVRTISNV